MPNRALPVTALALVLITLLAACAGGAASAPPAPASPGGGTATDEPQATPAATAAAAERDAIDHPTGATDVILRVSETGGFVPMDYAMVRLPLFTLYGDGRVLVVAPEGTAKGAPGMLDSVPVLLETRLDEAGIQAVLASALTEGRLGVAKADYAPMALDLPTTLFEIQAGGVSKTVSVGGLSAEPEPGPDAPVITALAQLATRLRSIGAETPYEAPGWIALITEWERDPAQPAPAAWPWPGVEPADFALPGDADPNGFPRRLLTQAEAEAAGADLSAGGATGLRFEGPDGKVYAVVLRPALPEEAA